MIQELHYFPYEIQIPHRKRKGFFIFFLNKEGHWKMGDAAPLENWSTETLEEVERQLLQLKTDPYSWNEKLLYPSVHFALTEALSLHHPHLLPQSSYAFIEEEAFSLEKPLDALWEKGFRRVKIKTRFFNKKALLHAIELCAKKGFKLHLDANRAYSFDEAKDLFSPVQEALYYIEEPTYELEKLPFLELPLALDESLREDSYKKLLDHPYLRACIIKPMLMGGRARWQDIKQIADQKNIPVVISPSWESSLGLAQNIAIHQRMYSEEIPIGLGSLSYIKEKYPFLKFLKNRVVYTHVPFSLPFDTREKTGSYTS